MQAGLERGRGRFTTLALGFFCFLFFKAKKLCFREFKQPLDIEYSINISFAETLSRLICQLIDRVIKVIII